MRSEQKRPHYRRSLGAFVVLSTVAMGCIGVVAPGCGGGGSASVGDAGADGTSLHDGSAGDSLSAMDQTAGDSAMNGDSAMGLDSPEETALMDSGEPETGTGMETGSDSPSDSPEDSPADSPTEAAAGCTGTETACTATGITAGLCVGGVCTLCNDPADDSNCTASYGGANNPYICGAGGACEPGNCHSDANCTAGQICGVTTGNFCGVCSTDTQCQTDPSYGAGTICNTGGGGLCVTATCTNANGACANPADICCATGGPADTCTPGNCCTNTQCTTAAASICGSQKPNTCGPCTQDSQCAGSAIGPVCDIATGDCVATAGQCTGTPTGGNGGAPGTCGANPNDMCCQAEPCIPKPGNGAIACCPGSAGTTLCQQQPPTGLGSTAATCTANFTCTTCEAVSTTAPTYYVDPVNGDDGATGSALGGDAGPAEGCALKSITRALKLISLVGTTVPTTIVIVGSTTTDTTVTDTAETFPLVIPANVKLTTQAGAGSTSSPITVQVTSANSGFVLASANTGTNTTTITSVPAAPLTITSAVANGAPVGTNGIQVTGNAAAASTTISGVTISGMLNDGIVVGGAGGGATGTGGSVTIGAGVVSENNVHGLHVTGTGSVVIDVPAGSTQTAFNNNSQHGILVDTSGSVNLVGAPSTGGSGPPTGTVMTSQNSAAGVWIQQTPQATQQNVINGLVSYLNTGGNGMRIVAGSNVQVRNSLFLNNSGNGVIISSSTAGATAADDNNLANIDLGKGTTNGGNTFQAPLSGAHNGGSGICLDIAPAYKTIAGVVIVAPQTLNAVGDTFSALTCTGATTGTLTFNNLGNQNGCANSVAQCATGVCDLGIMPNGNVPAGDTGIPNTFDVSTCTQ